VRQLTSSGSTGLCITGSAVQGSDLICGTCCYMMSERSELLIINQNSAGVVAGTRDLRQRLDYSRGGMARIIVEGE
jgi:hypothetical protein